MALVRNLHTGHISPQYHIVFDDKFETVFNDGKSLEELAKICAELFVNSPELYVEDEYNEDGMLVYRPPPLDEVWLSEAEQRDRQKQLDEQRDRASRQIIVESREVKKRRKRSRSSAPDLVESDVESDDEDSVCEDPQFKSRGDVVSVERDMWADHPAWRLYR